MMQQQQEQQHQDKQHMDIYMDAHLDRPCSASEGSLSASEVFSTANIECDGSDVVPADDRAPAHMQNAVRTLLAGVGEDPDRQGLRDTPKRVAKAWLDITTGYSQDVDSIMGQALFDEPTVSHGSGGMVLVRDIEFASTSAANLLPFHGRCHIAYVPRRGVVLGLSKFARLTKLYARRFQDQQDFTDQILRSLSEQLAPVGTAVLVEAKHMAEGPEAPTHLTSAAQGLFNDPASSCTAEFLALLRLNGVPVSPSDGMPSAPRMISEPVEKRNVVGRGLRHPACHAAAIRESNARSHADLENGPRLQQPITQASRRCSADLARMQEAARQQEAAAQEAALASTAQQQQQQSSQLEAAHRLGCDAEMAEAPQSGALRPSPAQMEEAVGVLLDATVPSDMRENVEDGAAAYVRQFLASTSGYNVSLPDIAASPEAAPLASVPAGLGRRNAFAAAHGVEEFHVRFGSQCEHHLLPFYGTTHVAYLPGAAGPRLTLRQLEAVVAMYSRRLQIQERLTHQLAAAVEDMTGAEGVLVVVEALHMCMVARGVERHASSTTTVAARGKLEADGAARSQLLLSLCLN